MVVLAPCQLACGTALAVDILEGTSWKENAGVSCVVSAKIAPVCHGCQLPWKTNALAVLEKLGSGLLLTS